MNELRQYIEYIARDNPSIVTFSMDEVILTAGFSSYEDALKVKPSVFLRRFFQALQKVIKMKTGANILQGIEGLNFDEIVGKVKQSDKNYSESDSRVEKGG